MRRRRESWLAGQLTERAAASVASVAQALRERGHDPPAVAHFVNRLVFCMFADDVGLLPGDMFTRMLRHALRAPKQFPELAGELFRVMASGGWVGFETVAWFQLPALPSLQPPTRFGKWKCRRPTYRYGIGQE